jgi:hypothetical protein
LLSNLEYINSTSRPTPHSISAWSSTLRSPLQRNSPLSLSPPHSPTSFSNAFCSLHLPRDRKANPRSLHSHNQWLLR